MRLSKVKSGQMNNCRGRPKDRREYLEHAINYAKKFPIFSTLKQRNQENAHDATVIVIFPQSCIDSWQAKSSHFLLSENFYRNLWGS